MEINRIVACFLQRKSVWWKMPRRRQQSFAAFQQKKSTQFVPNPSSSKFTKQHVAKCGIHQPPNHFLRVFLQQRMETCLKPRPRTVTGGPRSDQLSYRSKKLKNRDSDWCSKNPLVWVKIQPVTNIHCTWISNCIFFKRGGGATRPIGSVSTFRFSRFVLILQKCHWNCTSSHEKHIMGWYDFLVSCSFFHTVSSIKTIAPEWSAAKQSAPCAPCAPRGKAEWDFDCSPSWVSVIVFFCFHIIQRKNQRVTFRWHK